MGELGSDLTGTGTEPGRPGDDARIGHSSLVHLALPTFERGVARHGPAPRVIVVAQRATDLIDAVVHLADPCRVEVGEPHVVDGAVRTALRAGAVVRDHQDQGVVELAESAKEVDHPTQLMIGMGEEAGEALHESGGHRPLAIVECLPCRHPGRPG